MSQVHRIEFTPKAVEMLEAVQDRRERELLLERIEALATDPELQGKALLGELRGHRSVRAVGQRYRIVYRVLRGEVLVLVGGPSGKLRLLAKGLGKLATLATSKTFPHPSCETKKGTPSAAPCAFNVLRLTERA